MQQLYVIRHGQSQANADHIIAGSHESPLSETGERQAIYAAETARQFFTFDLIVSSPMSRAHQTADIIAQRIGYPHEDILILDDLRERNLGDVEGKDYSEAPHHNGNYEDAENVPGVEPIDELYTRMERVLALLRARPEKNILIVAHNGCLRMLKVAIHQDPPMSMYHQPRLDNAVIYRVI